MWFVITVAILVAIGFGLIRYATRHDSQAVTNAARNGAAGVAARTNTGVDATDITPSTAATAPAPAQATTTTTAVATDAGVAPRAPSPQHLACRPAAPSGQPTVVPLRQVRFQYQPRADEPALPGWACGDQLAVNWQDMTANTANCRFCELVPEVH